MSNAEIDKQGNGESSKDICRDFLRNICRRGKNCRFRHPDQEEAKSLEKWKLVDFCHDYQNKECHRPNCKFIHCSKQDEEYYRSTGQIPDHIIETHNQTKKAVNGNQREVPACKDFFKGECRRSGRCKYRHVSFADYQRQCAARSNLECEIEKCDSLSSYNAYEGFEPQAKRRAYDSTYFDQCHALAERRHFSILEDENRLLMHKVEELKKQVSDLTATNEFLLDQNAQLRVSKQTLVSPISQQLIPHTLTPTLTSIPAPSITQLSQLPLSSELGPDLAATQTMAQSMVPVTLAQRIAPVSMASTQVTLPPISASLSQSLPHTLMTSTALISYPIMTQSMRPVIPQSLGH